MRPPPLRVAMGSGDPPQRPGSSKEAPAWSCGGRGARSRVRGWHGNMRETSWWWLCSGWLTACAAAAVTGGRLRGTRASRNRAFRACSRGARRDRPGGADLPSVRFGVLPRVGTGAWVAGAGRLAAYRVWRLTRTHSVKSPRPLQSRDLAAFGTQCYNTTWGNVPEERLKVPATKSEI